MKKTLLSLAIASSFSGTAFALDFGQKVEALAKAQSYSLFGVISPLGASSNSSVTTATANADPKTLITLAPGLSAKVISSAPTST